MLKTSAIQERYLPPKGKKFVLKWLNFRNSSIIKTRRVIQQDDQINGLRKLFDHYYITTRMHYWITLHMISLLMVYTWCQARQELLLVINLWVSNVHFHRGIHPLLDLYGRIPMFLCIITFNRIPKKWIQLWDHQWLPDPT